MRRRPYLLVAAAVVGMLGAATVLFHKQQAGSAEVVSAIAISSQTKEPPGSDADEFVQKKIAKTGGRPFALSSDDRVTVPAGSLVDVVHQLASHAQAGDAKAAFALFLKVRECGKAFDQGVEAGELQAYKQVSADVGLLKGVDERLKNCEDAASYSSLQKRWLEQAAESGLLEAQLMYATSPESVIGDPSQMFRDPAAVQRYKTKAVGYLGKQAGAGNIDAMQMLASSYYHGGLVKRDLMRSYAYYRLIDLADPGLMTEEFLSGRAARLSASDLRQAELLAQVLHQRCCK